MRKIHVNKIKKTVAELCIKANIKLRSDVLSGLKRALVHENNKTAKEILGILIENARIAKKEGLAICQDTGMVVVFCRMGDKARIIGDLNKAINEGVKQGYRKGLLRKSIVSPLLRKNTNTNAPAVIHYDFINGDKIELDVMPKGFGSENTSQVKMLNPSDGPDKIKEFAVGAVKDAGASACPPVILGIGIGGTLDKAAQLSKEALLKGITAKNPKRHIAKLEKDILKAVNKTSIGPMGLGGKTTCLGVNILEYPTHIAGLPVCVNISCHATRGASAVV